MTNAWNDTVYRIIADMSKHSRIIIGISGASGFIYGIRALELLQTIGTVETHLVVSSAAHQTLQNETKYRYENVAALADVTHDINHIGSTIASGSFKTLGMLVAPCSMHTLASIAHCFSDNLLTRAADVTLKERRTLVLMTREAPLHLGHIRNMEAATLAGAIIYPPVPAMYTQFKTIQQMVSYSVERALNLFGLDTPGTPEWQGTTAI